MDSDSIDSGRDSRRLVGGDPEPGLSRSWNGEVMGDLIPVEEHPLRRLPRAGVLFKCRLLLEENLPDLVQSFLWAITLMTLFGALVRWFWRGRLFAQRVKT
jgi:hypothetical protein